MDIRDKNDSEQNNAMYFCGSDGVIRKILPNGLQEEIDYEKLFPNPE